MYGKGFLSVQPLPALHLGLRRQEDTRAPQDSHRHHRRPPGRYRGDRPIHSAGPVGAGAGHNGVKKREGAEAPSLSSLFCVLEVVAAFWQVGAVDGHQALTKANAADTVTTFGTDWACVDYADESNVDVVTEILCRVRYNPLKAMGCFRSDQGADEQVFDVFDIAAPDLKLNQPRTEPDALYISL